MQIHPIKSVMDPCLLLLGIPQLFIVQESPIGPYGRIRQQAKTQSKIHNLLAACPCFAVTRESLQLFSKTKEQYICKLLGCVEQPLIRLQVKALSMPVP
jgi:hypothetical protein